MKIDRSVAIVAALAAIAIGWYFVTDLSASAKDPIVGLWVDERGTDDIGFSMEFFDDGVVSGNFVDKKSKLGIAEKSIAGKWLRVEDDRIRIVSSNALRSEVIIMSGVRIDDDVLVCEMGKKPFTMRRKRGE